MKPVSISNPIKQFSVRKSVAVASLVASLIIIAAVIAADYHFPDDTYGGENVGLAIVYNDTEVPIEAVVSWSVSGVIYTPNFTAYTKAVSNSTPVSTPSSPILSPAYTSITEISVTTATHSYGYTGSNAGMLASGDYLYIALQKTGMQGQLYSPDPIGTWSSTLYVLDIQPTSYYGE